MVGQSASGQGHSVVLDLRPREGCSIDRGISSIVRRLITAAISLYVEDVGLFVDSGYVERRFLISTDIVTEPRD